MTSYRAHRSKGRLHRGERAAIEPGGHAVLFRLDISFILNPGYRILAYLFIEWLLLYGVVVEGQYTLVIPAASRMSEYCVQVAIGRESRSLWRDSYVDGPDAVSGGPRP